MRIAYVTTDEVNQALAEQMATECNGVVFKLLPKDPPPDGRFDAVLYDLDVMPREQRLALLDQLRIGRPVQPTAVHGYDITDEQAKNLRRNGVAASRRLYTGLLRSLCESARQIQETVPPDDASTDLTWVDLAK